MSGGKFAFQNRLGQPYSWMDIYRFCCVLLCTSPREVYIWRGDLTEGFLCYEFGGLIFGGAYFRNFMVYNSQSCIEISSLLVCKRWHFSLKPYLSEMHGHSPQLFQVSLAQLVEHLPADWEVAGLHPRSELSLPCKWVDLPVA